jgi:hypothetical protein
MQRGSKERRRQRWVGAYQLEDIAQVGTFKEETVSNFQVNGYPHEERSTFLPTLFSVDLHRPRAYRYIADDQNTELRRQAAQLDELFTARQRRTLDRLTSEPARVGVGVFFLLIAVFASTVPWKLSLAYQSPSAFLWAIASVRSLAITVAAIFIVPTIRSKNTVTIFLADSHAKTSFWDRNKDALILQGITGVISFIAGVLATLLTFWLTNH